MNIIQMNNYPFLGRQTFVPTNVATADDHFGLLWRTILHDHIHRTRKPSSFGEKFDI